VTPILKDALATEALATAKLLAVASAADRHLDDSPDAGVQRV
jgi:hypothetical protein